MRPKEPYIATMKQVRIRRDGEYAEIDYVEPNVGGVNLHLGNKLNTMTDEEILDAHNDCIRSQNHMRLNYKYTAFEIPIGKPQIEFSPKCNQWTPRGGVVRALIDDGGDYIEGFRVPTIIVDGKELSWAEFGSLVCTYDGWGMRFTFVPDDELSREPSIVVKEPKENDKCFEEEVFPTTGMA